MSTHDLDHGSPIDTLAFDDFGRFTCQWDEWPCSDQQVTHRILSAGKVVFSLCPRHYVAHLARTVALHQLECDVPPPRHQLTLSRPGLDDR